MKPHARRVVRMMTEYCNNTTVIIYSSDSPQRKRPLHSESQNSKQKSSAAGAFYEEGKHNGQNQHGRVDPKNGTPENICTQKRSTRDAYISARNPKATNNVKSST